MNTPADALVLCFVGVYIILFGSLMISDERSTTFEKFIGILVALFGVSLVAVLA